MRREYSENFLNIPGEPKTFVNLAEAFIIF